MCDRAVTQSKTTIAFTALAVIGLGPISSLGPLGAQPASAQSDSGEWAAFTSMREVNGVFVGGGDVWAATDGGVLRYSLLTKSYERFTSLDGLAGNRVLSVARDRHGQMWFGTEGSGLTRYDTETDTFSEPYRDFEGLSINVVLPAGDLLFVGTDIGVSVFLPDREEVKETYRRLGRMTKDSAVNTMTIHNGFLWVGTDEGISRADLSQPNLQDPDSWETLSLSAGKVHDMRAVQGTLYVAAFAGAYSFDETVQRFHTEYDEEATSVSLLRGQPVIAVASGNFLRREGVGEWERISGPVIKDVRAMDDRGRVLWLATAAGIRIIGGGDPPPSLEPAGNRFFEMEIHDGDLWVASAPNDHFEASGVYQLTEEVWSVYDKASGMPTDDLVSLKAGFGGRLWVGSWGFGVSILNPSGSWSYLDETNTDLQGIGTAGDFVVVSDIARDDDNTMWLMNVKFGILVVDGHRAIQSHFIDQTALGFPAEQNLNKIVIGPDGLKWLTSPTRGFGVLDDGGTPFDGDDDRAVFIEAAVESRLSSDRVADLQIGVDGTIWIATDNGLNSVQGTYNREANSLDIRSWRVFDEADGLPSSVISDLELDSCGNMWVATEAGLTHISSSGEVAIPMTTKNSGLIDNRVNSLLFDAASEQLWIGTFEGLNRLRIPDCDEQNPIGLVVYPNPYLNASAARRLTFDGLPLGATLKIYTAAGELIKRLDGVPGQGRLIWNGQNESGFLVGSGVYLFVADDGTGDPVRGKFAVVSTP